MRSFARSQLKDIRPYIVEKRMIDRIVPEYQVTDKRLKSGEMVHEDKLSRFNVFDEQGEQYNFDHLKSNPDRILLLDGEGVTTCSPKYAPVQDAELYGRAMEMAKLVYPDAEFKSYVGKTRFQTFGVITLEKNKVLPWDERENPKGYDFNLIIVNSMDATSSIQMHAMVERLICSNGMADIQMKAKADNVRHIFSGDDMEKLMSKVYKSIESLLMGYEFPEVKWRMWAEQKAEKALVLKAINELNLTNKEAESLTQHGITLMKNDDGVYHDMKLMNQIMVKNKIPVSVWDYYMALTNMTNTSKTLERQVELQVQIPRAVEMIAQ